MCTKESRVKLSVWTSQQCMTQHQAYVLKYKVSNPQTGVKQIQEKWECFAYFFQSRLQEQQTKYLFSTVMWRIKKAIADKLEKSFQYRPKHKYRLKEISLEVIKMTNKSAHPEDTEETFFIVSGKLFRKRAAPLFPLSAAVTSVSISNSFYYSAWKMFEM